MRSSVIKYHKELIADCKSDYRCCLIMGFALRTNKMEGSISGKEPSIFTYLAAEIHTLHAANIRRHQPATPHQLVGHNRLLVRLLQESLSTVQLVRGFNYIAALTFFLFCWFFLCRFFLLRHYLITSFWLIKFFFSHINIIMLLFAENLCQTNYTKS